MVETRACVGEADASGELSLEIADTRAVVAHLKRKTPIKALGANLDQTAGFAVGDAVADGVLDQRLKYELWHQPSERCRIYLQTHSQTVAMPCLFDFEIMLEK